MKKILIIGLGFFAFACNDTNTTNKESDNEATRTEEAAGENDVEIGSGEEISPQLEGLEDTGRLEVDTLSSAAEEQQRQQQHRKH
ncbi:hypothetical protein [Pontibacter burrus]|uniref:Uncharacterized protein n=1 Tax=Pontibacter burrus TaxID=2704466 RepID=A0A6B3LQN5_9BACT|nr:hypothetical protein [Pontibacter burrus]NEM99109.1 hypothetical protein [Pontibacter burrus]